MESWIEAKSESLHLRKFNQTERNFVTSEIYLEILIINGSAKLISKSYIDR